MVSPRLIAEAFSGHRFAEAYEHLADDVVWVMPGYRRRRQPERGVLLRHLRVSRRPGRRHHLVHGRARPRRDGQRGRYASARAKTPTTVTVRRA